MYSSNVVLVGGNKYRQHLKLGIRFNDTVLCNTRQQLKLVWVNVNASVLALVSLSVLRCDLLQRLEHQTHLSFLLIVWREVEMLVELRSK